MSRPANRKNLRSRRARRQNDGTPLGHLSDTELLEVRMKRVGQRWGISGRAASSDFAPSTACTPTPLAARTRLHPELPQPSQSHFTSQSDRAPTRRGVLERPGKCA